MQIIAANDPENNLMLLDAEANGYNVLRNSSGQLYGSSLIMQSNLWHPLGMIENYTNESWRTHINGTVYAEFKPFKGLVYTSRAGYRFGNFYTSNYTDAYYWNTNQLTMDGALEANLDHTAYIQWENFANYMFTLGRNNFTAMAGMRFSNDNVINVSGSTSQLDSNADNYRYLDYSAGDATDQPGGNNLDYRNISYFGRLEWNYDSKYLLQGSIRADAYDASKLSEENRWGYFPSVSAGWVVTNEKFMQDLALKSLSYFKLRGILGYKWQCECIK